MIDRSLFYYVKNELSQGKTKEEIGSSLIQGGGWDQKDVEQAFAEVQSGNIPGLAVHKSDTKSKVIAGIFIFILVVAIGFGVIYIIQNDLFQNLLQTAFSNK